MLLDAPIDGVALSGLRTQEAPGGPGEPVLHLSDDVVAGQDPIGRRGPPRGEAGPSGQRQRRVRGKGRGQRNRSAVGTAVASLALAP